MGLLSLQPANFELSLEYLVCLEGLIKLIFEALNICGLIIC